MNKKRFRIEICDENTFSMKIFICVQNRQNQHEMKTLK